MGEPCVLLAITEQKLNLTSEMIVQVGERAIQRQICGKEDRMGRRVTLLDIRDTDTALKSFTIDDRGENTID